MSEVGEVKGGRGHRRVFRNPGWWVAFAGTLVIALLAMSPPVLGGGARDIVMSMFSGVCHQLSGRSPHVDGVQLAVCHRCAGIYWGLPAAALVFALTLRAAPIRRHVARGAPLLLIAAAMPAGIDWALDVVGLWPNTPVSRVLTGAGFGLGAGWFLVRATSEAGSDTTGAPARKNIREDA